MRLRRFILFLLLGGLASLSLYAQAQSTQERIQQLILAKLVRELDLNPSEARQMEQALQRNREFKLRLRGEIRNQTEALRRHTQGGVSAGASSQGLGSSASKSSVAATMAELNEAQKNLNRADEALMSDVKTLLDPERLARFVLVMQEIRNEIRSVKESQSPPPPVFYHYPPIPVHPAPQGIWVP